MLFQCQLPAAVIAHTVPVPLPLQLLSALPFFLLSAGPSHFVDLLGQRSEFDNKMSWCEMPEQHAVGLGIIIAAFNEDGV